MIKLLPIGTVVELEDAKTPFMIAGYFPKDKDSDYRFDYAGFPYPLGFTAQVTEPFPFDTGSITEILVMGYEDQECDAFLKKLESFQEE